MYFNGSGAGSSAILAQIIKEEIKREIIAELWARQGYYYTPESPEPLEKKVKDSRGKMAGGAGQPRKMGDQSGGGYDPCAGNAGGRWPVGVCAPYAGNKEGWPAAGVPEPLGGNAEETTLGEPHIAHYLDQRTAHDPAPGWFNDLTGGWFNGPAGGWFNEEAIDRGKGILYGIGTMALLGLFLPSFGRKMQSILTRAAAEGMELLEKARSIAARAREDIEDLIAEANIEKLMKQPRQ